MLVPISHEYSPTKSDNESIKTYLFTSFLCIFYFYFALWGTLNFYNSNGTDGKSGRQSDTPHYELLGPGGGLWGHPGGDGGGLCDVGQGGTTLLSQLSGFIVYWVFLPFLGSLVIFDMVNPQCPA